MLVASPNIITRAYRWTPTKPFYVFAAGSELAEYCLKCFDLTGECHALGQLQISESGKRYQECTNQTGERHAVFLGKDREPMVLQAGLEAPHVPDIPNRGTNGKGKRLCAAEDCPRPAGSKECTTSRDAQCCAELAIKERLAGRDGGALCSIHKPQYLKALDALSPELLDALNNGLFTSTQSTTADKLESTPSPPSPPLPSTSITHLTRPQPAISSTSPTRSTPQPVASTSRAPELAPPAPIQQQTSRAPPRAMPVKLSFVRPNLAEDERYQRATQRAHREDLLANPERDIRAVFWGPQKSKMVITVSVKEHDTSTFSIGAYENLKIIVREYGGPIVEVYDIQNEEWVVSSLNTPWNLFGRNHILIRDGSLADSKCVGLTEELAQLLATGPQQTSFNMTSSRPLVLSSSSRPLALSSSASAAVSSVRPAKRKADNQLAPSTTKVPRIGDQMRVKVNTIDNIDPQSIQDLVSHRARASQVNSGDSPLASMPFIDVANGLESVRLLKVVHGVDIEVAFGVVFRGIPFKATTFKRHRDALFWAKPTVVQEWKQSEGSRIWKEFYQRRQSGQFEGTVNGWLPTEKEETELASGKAMARRQKVEDRAALFRHRYAGKGVGHAGGLSSDDDGVISEVTDRKPHRYIKMEDSSEDDFDALDALTSRATKPIKKEPKGKGPAEPMTDTWKYWKGIGKKNEVKVTGEKKEVEVIEISDSDSD